MFERLQMQELTEVTFHAQRLVLLELCNGVAKQRNDDALNTTCIVTMTTNQHQHLSTDRHTALHYFRNNRLSVTLHRVQVFSLRPISLSSSPTTSTSGASTKSPTIKAGPGKGQDTNPQDLC